MSSKKWPPLDPGTRIRTTKPNESMRREWTDDCWVRKRSGVLGTIIRHQSGHGLYYDVRHEDGTECGYDPSEFEVITAIKPPLGIEPMKIWQQRRIQDLLTAMKRYTEASQIIPVEWIEELQTHFDTTNKK